jgi:hypothetical protein
MLWPGSPFLSIERLFHIHGVELTQAARSLLRNDLDSSQLHHEHLLALLDRFLTYLNRLMNLMTTALRSSGVSRNQMEWSISF